MGVGIYWRADGEPLWRDAGVDPPEKPDRRTRHRIADATGTFAEELCRTLGLPGDARSPPTKMPPTSCCSSSKLPLEGRPANGRLIRSGREGSIDTRVRPGLGTGPTGYVLPLLMARERARRAKVHYGALDVSAGAFVFGTCDLRVGLTASVDGLAEVSLSITRRCCRRILLRTSASCRRHWTFPRGARSRAALRRTPQRAGGG